MYPQSFGNPPLAEGFASCSGPWVDKFNLSANNTPVPVHSHYYDGSGNNQIQHWQHCGYRTASSSTSIASSEDSYYQQSHFGYDYVEPTQQVYQIEYHSSVPNFECNQLNQTAEPDFEPQSMSDLIIFKQQHPVKSKPQDRITIVRSSDGSTRTIVKRKRKRTAFTTEQVAVLERFFSKNPYVNRDERRELVNQLQINDRAVKVWFQNRRIKEKRIETSPSSISDDEDWKPESSLAYVESQINENTDASGFVNLDSRALDELAKAISEAVTDDLSFYETDKVQAVPTLSPTSEDTSTELSDNATSQVMTYEPISSPISSQPDHTNDDIVWSLLQPEENLKALLNIDSGHVIA